MRLIPDWTWAAICIWQESRGEPQEGKIAVAEVILRRTQRKIFSKGTVASTVLWPYQFSGFNTKDPNRTPSALLDTDDQAVQDCIRAWTDALAGSDITKGATHYYNPSVVTPPWASSMTVTAKVGNHIFLKEVA